LTAPHSATPQLFYSFSKHWWEASPAYTFCNADNNEGGPKRSLIVLLCLKDQLQAHPHGAVAAGKKLIVNEIRTRGGRHVSVGGGHGGIKVLVVGNVEDLGNIVSCAPMIVEQPVVVMHRTARSSVGI
jgi:hypothetical protein